MGILDKLDIYYALLTIYGVLIGAGMLAARLEHDRREQERQESKRGREVKRTR
jgi:hypothetical protein